MSDRIIKFSNFATAGRLKNTVAISRTVPRWYKGDRDLNLAPPMEIFKAYKGSGDIERFMIDYYEYIYDTFDIVETAELCIGKILLCWCPRGEFCHRQLLAKIFEKEAGVKVEEIGGWKLDWFSAPFEKVDEFVEVAFEE